MTNTELEVQDNELLRFVQILDGRIKELEQEVERQNETLISQKSLLMSLQRQKQHMVGTLADAEWIHINECSLYPELPQPSTLREWIRKGFLTEGTHFKKIGPRGKVYISPKSVKDVKSFDLKCN